jgi:hypothetical protein
MSVQTQLPSAAPPNQRRRFQFSLHSLFVATTVLAFATLIVRFTGPASIPPLLLALWILTRVSLPRNAGMRTGIRWKRVFFCALAALAMFGAAEFLILSQLPTGGADLRVYDVAFVKTLREIDPAVVSGSVTSFFVAIVGLIGWSFTGR